MRMVFSRSGCGCAQEKRSEAASSRASCCSQRAPSVPTAPTGTSDDPRIGSGDPGCRCEIRSPEPGPALPRSLDSRRAGGESIDGIAEWLAAGSRASAAAPCVPSGPDPPLPACFESVSSAPSAVARHTGRGVTGLLAVYGIARL
jgi:hypothetical protein